MTLYEKLEKEFNEFCDSKDCKSDKCEYWWTIGKDMCRSHFILTKLKEIDIDKEKEQIKADVIDKFAELLIIRCWSKMGDLEYVSEEEIDKVRKQLKKE